MIRTILCMLVGAVTFTTAFIILEKRAEKKPESRLTRWWRRHIVSDTHKED